MCRFFVLKFKYGGDFCDSASLEGTGLLCNFNEHLTLLIATHQNAAQGLLPVNGGKKSQVNHLANRGINVCIGAQVTLNTGGPSFFAISFWLFPSS